MQRRFVIAALSFFVSFPSPGTGNADAGNAKAAACTACHGDAGRSSAPEWPSLAGQNQSYLMKQLGDFKSTKRRNELMGPIAAGLTEQDIADLAAYFASQTPAPGSAAAGLVPYGMRIYRRGERERGVPACMGCHGPSGAGNPAAAVPALAGQQALYTAKRLRGYRSSERGNDPSGVMRGIAGKMSDEGIDAVSSYTSGLH
ncbi:MAG: c-type cytochrome [Gammaproteobacteria bacterium]